MTCFPRHGARAKVEMVTCPRCRTTAIGNPGEPLFYLRLRLSTHPCPGPEKYRREGLDKVTPGG